jgi:hypothetical protein
MERRAVYHGNEAPMPANSINGSPRENQKCMREAAASSSWRHLDTSGAGMS